MNIKRIIDEQAAKIGDRLDRELYLGTVSAAMQAGPALTTEMLDKIFADVMALPTWSRMSPALLHRCLEHAGYDAKLTEEALNFGYDVTIAGMRVQIDPYMPEDMVAVLDGNGNLVQIIRLKEGSDADSK